MKQVFLLNRMNNRRNPGMLLLLVLLLFSMAVISAGVFAQESGQSANRQQQKSGSLGGEELSSPDIRATELVGRSVQNESGDPIAEVEDLIIDRQGRIQHIILSVGGLLGIADKLIAVDFDEVNIRTRWNYRTIRTQDGTETKIAWGREQRVIFLGGEDELRRRRSYDYKEKYPRGGPQGWGIYSYPAGPKSIEEVP
jgi:sporulation protein YlmC with PRC-barrel domain